MPNVGELETTAAEKDPIMALFRCHRDGGWAIVSRFGSNRGMFAMIVLSCSKYGGFPPSNNLPERGQGFADVGGVRNGSGVLELESM